MTKQHIKACRLLHLLGVVSGMLYCPMYGLFAAEGSVLKKWSPEVSVRLRYPVVDPSEGPREVTFWPMTRGREESVVFSPDRRQLFFVFHHGDLDTDSNIYELQVFRMSDIEAAQALGIASPYRTVRLRSYSSSDGAICRAQWAEEGDAIYFLGASESRTLQGYRLNTTTGLLEQLTKYERDVLSFNARGAGVIFHDRLRRSPEVSYPIVIPRREADGVPILRESDYERVSFFSYGGATPKHLEGNTAYLWLSPQGRYAVGLDYIDGSVGTSDDDPDNGPKARFAILDLRSGATKIILDASVGAIRSRQADIGRRMSARALWSSDGARVVLINTEIPQSSDGAATTYLVDYEVSSGRWRPLEPMETADRFGRRHISNVKWRIPGKEFLVTYQQDGKTVGGTVYSFEDRVWNARALDTTKQITRNEAEKSVTVELKHAANEPHTYIASIGKRKVKLNSLDPALRGIWRAPLTPFQWHEGDKLITGGLHLPRDFVRGHPIPLVVLPYHYQPNAFLPDGSNPSIDAAQTFAALGIAVLRFDILDLNTATEREGPDFVRRLDAAIATLANQGIADPERIAIAGFSRGGYLAYYAITHPGTITPSAIVASDSYKGSYSSYLARFPRAGRTPELESMLGGSFWSNKAAWLTGETSFNIDRVKTPALFSLHGNGFPTSDLGIPIELDVPTLVAFVLNRKPFEFFYIPTGVHQLVRPQERLASISIVVQWVAFWLRGTKPEDPQRAAQWLKLREQQQLVLNQLRAQGTHAPQLPPLVTTSKSTAEKQL